MLGPAVVIVIAVAAALAIFTVGSIGVVFYVRHKHRQIIERHRLALDGPQYANRASVMSEWEHRGSVQNGGSQRHSLQLPYGMASEGWNTLPAGDAGSPANSVAMFHPSVSPIMETTTAPKRKQSLRKSFSAHSFSIPKTRRQRKLEKAIPLSQMARSPLSAITERSGTNTEAPSPATGFTELPTDITPRLTPDKANSTTNEKRMSQAWPLPAIENRQQESTQAAPNVPIRANSNGRSKPYMKSNLGTRSISMSSQLSAAPDEPLPPLPVIRSNEKGPRRQESTSGYSTFSSESVSTSVLAPSATPRAMVSGAEVSYSNCASPSINIHQTGLQKYDVGRNQQEPSILSLGSTPEKRTLNSTRRAKAGLGSTHGSIRTTSILASALAGHGTSNNEPSSQMNTGLETIDASKWDPSPARRFSGHRNSLRRSSIRSPSQRHSMFETTSDVGSGSIPTPASPSSSKRIRPVSVGAATALSDGRSLSARSSMSSIGSSGSQRKGHKRQNCVRIANLPVVDANRRHSKMRLPLMAEEEEHDNPDRNESPESSSEKLVQIPGLNLLNQPQGVHQRASSKSPFDNRPVLQPSTQARPAMPRRDTDDTDSSGSNSDADVFSTEKDRAATIAARKEEGSSNPYGVEMDRRTAQNRLEEKIRALNQTQRTLTPPRRTPSRETRSPATPVSAAKALKDEPYNPNSPILPTPTLSTANLFARKFQSRYAKKSAGGPNGPRAQALGLDTSDSVTSSRAASPTPVRSSRMDTSKAPVKGSSGQDLRKSAMMLRRMNSDLREDSVLGNSYRSYRNFGDGKSGSNSPHYSMDEAEGQQGKREELRSPDSIASVRMQMKSPSTADMLTYSNVDAPRNTYLRADRVSGPLNNSRSRHNVRGVGVSPSVLSIGGQSDMWEDASVKSDNDEPAPPAPREPAMPVIQGKENRPISTGYESFAGVCEVYDPGPVNKMPAPAPAVQRFEGPGGGREAGNNAPANFTPTHTPKDKKRQGGMLMNPESAKKSPGYGLGLMGLGLSAWGTPASLYDKDGFLKE